MNGPDQPVHRPGCAGYDQSQTYGVTPPETCSGDHGPYLEVPCNATELKSQMEQGAMSAEHKSAFMADTTQVSPSGSIMNKIISRINDISDAMAAHCEKMTKTMG